MPGLTEPRAGSPRVSRPSNAGNEQRRCAETLKIHLSPSLVCDRLTPQKRGADVVNRLLPCCNTAELTDLLTLLQRSLTLCVRPLLHILRRGHDKMSPRWTGCRASPDRPGAAQNKHCAMIVYGATGSGRPPSRFGVGSGTSSERNTLMKNVHTLDGRDLPRNHGHARHQPLKRRAGPCHQSQQRKCRPRGEAHVPLGRETRSPLQSSSESQHPLSPCFAPSTRTTSCTAGPLPAWRFRRLWLGRLAGPGSL